MIFEHFCTMSIASPPFLSIIIPAYNEESRIGASLEHILAYLAEQPLSAEIIVVSDGSRDRTGEVVRSFQGTSSTEIIFLEQPQNMGKGAAVRRGMQAAKGTYRLFSDADMSTPMYETARVLAELQHGADVCIGSRGVDQTLVKKHQPLYREMIGKTINRIIQAFFTPGITDTQCGFKGFTARAADAIFARAKLNGFIFDVELLYIASRLGFTVREIAVEWYNDERTTVGFRHSFNIIRELVSIKRLHRTAQALSNLE
jgi:dolichyl-phosphate beta-glucosyltransferase